MPTAWSRRVIPVHATHGMGAMKERSEGGNYTAGSESGKGAVHSMGAMQQLRLGTLPTAWCRRVIPACMHMVSRIEKTVSQSMVSGRGCIKMRRQRFLSLSPHFGPHALPPTPTVADPGLVQQALVVGQIGAVKVATDIPAHVCVGRGAHTADAGKWAGGGRK